MALTNIKITREDNLISLLDYKFVPELIFFDLVDASAAVANCIRVIGASYLETKFLWFDFTTIDTDESFILDYLLQRIAEIPIDQNVPNDFKVKLNVANNTQSSMFVYSKHFTPNTFCNPTHRLCKLEPGMVLNINNIGIGLGHTEKNNKNYIGIAPCMVLWEKYEMFDYEHVTVMCGASTCPIIGSTIIDAQHYVQPKNNEKNLYYTDIEYKPILEQYFSRTAKPSVLNKTFDLYDNFIHVKNMRTYQSTEILPKKWHLGFRTFGTLGAITILKRILQYIITEITNVEFIFDIDNFKPTKPMLWHLGYLILDSIKQFDDTVSITLNMPFKNEDNLVFYTTYVDKPKLANDAKKRIIDLFNSLLSSITKL